MRDEDLLQKLYGDPDGGMKTMIELYGGLVYAVVKGKLSASVFCAADIESCVADTFSEFYCDLDKYDPSRGSIRSWLCVIARNNALDRLRQYYKDSGAMSLDEAVSCADDVSLEGDFEDKEKRAELISAVNSLGDLDREILVRKFILSQSSKEIARVLDLTVSNVDVRTHRAIKRLHKRFGGDGV